MDNYLYQYGYPESMRINTIQEKIASKISVYPIEYAGKMRELPIIEVKKELPVYRMSNIRTKSLQKEYVSTHPEKAKTFLEGDPYSIENQEIQHQLLTKVAKDEGLEKAFLKLEQQKDPIIISNNGIVVNGNRRLCVWRNLHRKDPEKYKHFETIRVAVLPDHDEDSMYDMELALQVQNDYRANYSWHAIALDCKEKSMSWSENKIAERYHMKTSAINTYINCYDYAEKYLTSINHPNEWSIVDNDWYAFQSIVKCKNSIDKGKTGEKELFDALAYAFLQVPAKGDRKYSKIPLIQKYLSSISEKLISDNNINISKLPEKSILLIDDDNNQYDSKMALVAKTVLSLDAKTVVESVENEISNQQNLESEKKKKGYVLDQVSKADTALRNAVEQLNHEMNKEGILEHIKNIEGAIIALKAWINQ